MARRTKPGNQPDMRTLDDPEPKIPTITADMIQSLPGVVTGSYNLGPPALSRVYIAPDIRFHSTAPRPNAWRRFWTWALLGWKWERLK
jgi:hypothetical protein